MIPSSWSGRPTNCQNSMDLGLPIECDDEHWLSPDGEPLFQQPPGKPPKTTFFTNYIRLAQILAFAVRTIVGVYHAQFDRRRSS